MFPLVVVSKEWDYAQDAQLAQTMRPNKPTKSIPLVGKLEASIWQCLLEASQASLRTELRVFTESKKKN